MDAAAPCKTGRSYRLLVPLAPFALSLGCVAVIGTCCTTLLTTDALSFVVAMARATINHPADVLFYATPLILCGIAVAIPGQARLINIGAEGQMYLGAFIAGLLGHGYGIHAHLPVSVVFAVMLMCAMLVPGVVAAAAGWTRERLGVHEILVTLFSNFVIIGFLNYLVNVPAIRDPDAPQTRVIIDAFRWEPWLSSSRLHWGFGLALLTTIVAIVLLYRTSFGLRVRAVGGNPIANRRLGYSNMSVYVFTMLLSGAVAGLAGVQRVLGQDGRYIDGFSPGYGFIGLAVAFAAGYDPFRVLLVAVALGLIQKTGTELMYSHAFPRDLVTILDMCFLVAFVLFTQSLRSLPLNLKVRQ